MMIENVLAVTQDRNRRILRCNIVIEDGDISHVGEERDTSGLVIDGSTMIALPGLINTHTHVAMTEFRGQLDDMPLEEFLEKTYALDARRTEESVRRSAQMGIAEMLSSGTTSFTDLYYAEDVIAQECERAGIRGFLAWAVLDKEITTQNGDPLTNAEQFIRRNRSDLVTPMVGLQGVYACSRETLLSARQVAESAQTGMHMHLSETKKEIFDHQRRHGLRPVQWLESIGFFPPKQRLVAAHCVWLGRDEMSILSRNGVSASICTRSNLKLASGIASAHIMRREGMNLCIGTDSAATSNNLDVFEEMRTMCLTQKVNAWDAAALTAQDALDMATINGAAALGAQDRIGSLEPGKSADIVLLDARSRRIQHSSPVSSIVYAAEAGDVLYTIIGGRIVYSSAL